MKSHYDYCKLILENLRRNYVKVAGIIVEYNPFHNGHKYHIEQTKKLTGADYIIAIMSGNYVQRGEPAIINKHARCEMALLNDVDLVIELPTSYATSSAEYFAFGSISILHKLGIVDYVCFGSEIGNVKLLEYIAEILAVENELYKNSLNVYLKNGNSYPKARELALIDYLKAVKSPHAQEIKKIISSPNNILGIEYIKALKKLGSSITPITITRADNGYNETQLNTKTSFSSASSIRSNIYDIKTISKYVPKNVYNILKASYNKTFPITYNDFANIAFHNLLNGNTNNLSKYLDVDTIIANKLLNKVNACFTITDLLEASKSKDITHTRLSRALLHIILNETKKDFDKYIINGPEYARILGFKSTSSNLLKVIKKKGSISLINKLSLGTRNLSPTGKTILEHDIKCSELYNKIVYSKYNSTKINEYKEGVRII